MGIGIFTLALGANESREAAVTGEYFELRNALEAVTLIELLDRTGAVIARLDNPEQSDFVNPGRYDTVRITNGPVAQTVKHFYGTGDAGSRRTSGLVQVDGTVNVTGDVSMIEGEKNRALAGGMFTGTASQAAVGAQYAYAQLWNPVGSGKNLIVSNIRYGSTAVTAIAMGFHNGALLTNNTPTLALNKFADVAMGVGQVRAQASAGALLSVTMRVDYCSANVMNDWGVKGALIVPPGRGLMGWASTLGTNCLVNFEWLEEPI